MRCDTGIPLLESLKITPEVYSLRVPYEGEVKPGQFFMLRATYTPVLLPRAISVCDLKDGVLTFLVQRVGKGTELLSALRSGDTMTMTGPLGNGFPVEELTGRVALVGGGIGVAPLLYTARRLAERNVTVDACLGFRDRTFFTMRFEKLCETVMVTTESGSDGEQGYVTEVLDPKRYDTVLCCGPEPMMKAVAAQCAAVGTPVYLSLENKMACGVGGCLVCTCTDKEGHNRRTCLDGPVFRGEEVDFDA